MIIGRQFSGMILIVVLRRPASTVNPSRARNRPEQGGVMSNELRRRCRRWMPNASGEGARPAEQGRPPGGRHRMVGNRSGAVRWPVGHSHGRGRHLRCPQTKPLAASTDAEPSQRTNARGDRTADSGHAPAGHHQGGRRSARGTGPDQPSSWTTSTSMRWPPSWMSRR